MLKIVIPNHPVEAESIYARYLHFKQLCNHSTKLMVALEVSDVSQVESVVLRFWGEQVHSLTLKTSTFVKNNDGFPVLLSNMQRTIKLFMRSQTAIIL